jgi:hypothetical protein
LLEDSALAASSFLQESSSRYYFLYEWLSWWWPDALSWNVNSNMTNTLINRCVNDNSEAPLIDCLPVLTNDHNFWAWKLDTQDDESLWSAIGPHWQNHQTVFWCQDCGASFLQRYSYHTVFKKQRTEKERLETCRGTIFHNWHYLQLFVLCTENMNWKHTWGDCELMSVNFRYFDLLYSCQVNFNFFLHCFIITWTSCEAHIWPYQFIKKEKEKTQYMKLVLYINIDST